MPGNQSVKSRSSTSMNAGELCRGISVTSGTSTGMNAGEFEMLCQYRVQELKCSTNIKYKSYTTREYRA